MSFVDLMVQSGTLQKGTEAISSTGQRVPTWTTIDTIKCLVNTITERDVPKVGVFELVTHIIYGEYRTDITADPKARWRLLIGNQKYEIIEPYDPGGRKQHLEYRVRRLDQDVDV